MLTLQLPGKARLIDRGYPVQIIRLLRTLASFVRCHNNLKKGGLPMYSRNEPVAFESAAHRVRVPIWKAASAALVGNTLEWYDMALYAYFAFTISKLFFPTDSESLSLLITFGTFGVSFLIRPLGALVLGAYADKAGRKKSLTVSISLMLVGTLIIACIPTYAAIGVFAPIGIFVARLLQGFSAGGEFGSFHRLPD